MGCAPSAVPNSRNGPVRIPRIITELFREHQALLMDAGLRIDPDAWGPLTLSKEDTLLIIDMQNDFLTEDIAPDGGRFGVSEGGSCIAFIVKLIDKFADEGALIVATRDYHPFDHCSFKESGGPFPPHCVQGSPGSFFHPAIGQALMKAEKTAKNGGGDSIKRKNSFGAQAAAGDSYPKQSGRVQVVFKGFVEQIDSFGGFMYDEAYFKERMASSKWMPDDGIEGVKCAGPWTGCWSFKCSSLVDNIDAPPDIMAVNRPDKKAIHDMVPKKGRLLVVGLAFDFCVLDTSVNARKLGYEKVFICVEAVRAAHIPGIGAHGSGFLTPPAFITGKFKEHRINIVSVASVLGNNIFPPAMLSEPGRPTE